MLLEIGYHNGGLQLSMVDVKNGEDAENGR
jgi:hypothetical protein